MPKLALYLALLHWDDGYRFSTARPRWLAKEFRVSYGHARYEKGKWSCGRHRKRIMIVIGAHKVCN
jgi:hypothetical protein